METANKDVRTGTTGVGVVLSSRGWLSPWLSLWSSSDHPDARDDTSSCSDKLSAEESVLRRGGAVGTAVVESILQDVG